MSRESNLAKNTAILSLGTFLPKIASFITLPLLTGYLTKDEYGTYDTILVLVSLLLPALTLQIQTAAFRFLIDVKNDRKSVSAITTTIYAFMVPIALAALIILYFCLYKLDILLRISICIYFFIDLLVNATRQIVRGIAKNLKYSVSAIISSIGQLVLVVLLVWKMRQGILGGITALAGAELLSFIYLFFGADLHAQISFKNFSVELLKQMLKYSWPMVPNSMSMWVMRMSDRLVILAVMGPAANAVYAAANKIPQLLTIAQNTFTMAWQENASIVSKDKDADGYYTKMFSLMFDLMAGFMGMIIAVTPILFPLLIRGDYGEAYIQITILIMAMFFLSMSSYLGGIYVAYMQTKSVGITTAVAAGINLIVDIALIHFIGIFAASGSTLVSYIFLFFFRLINVQKYVKLRYDKKHMMIVFVVLLLECVLFSFQIFWLDIVNAVIACSAFVILNNDFMKTILAKLKKKQNRGAGTASEFKQNTNEMIYSETRESEGGMKRFPVLYRKKEECCGCTACAAVCPMKAIAMSPDEEGFLYPTLNTEKCITCYKCEKVCAFKAGQIEKGYTVEEETE